MKSNVQSNLASATRAVKERKGSLQHKHHRYWKRAGDVTGEELADILFGRLRVVAVRHMRKR